MKTIRLSKNVIGFSSMLALTIGLTSSVIAGPGPQFWQQQEKIRAENAAKAQAAAVAAKSADTTAMACASCKATDVTEYRSSQAGGKVPARYDKVGTTHTCAHCGMGSITVVKGVKTDSMTRGCAMCGPDAALCTKAAPPAKT